MAVEKNTAMIMPARTMPIFLMPTKELRCDAAKNSKQTPNATQKASIPNSNVSIFDNAQPYQQSIESSVTIPIYSNDTVNNK